MATNQGSPFSSRRERTRLSSKAKETRFDIAVLLEVSRRADMLPDTPE
nr:MAG TPA: hypothetical protein [Caudoviricetes sp.]